MTSSVTSICNRGLQILGAARILTITDNTRNGRSCNACYDILRQSELRKHRWRFAIERVTLAPLVLTDPLGKFTYAFQVPSDCLKILMPENDPYCDWQYEGKKIWTNSTDTLALRYIKDITDTTLMDVNFQEMLSAMMAVQMAEEITQSNSKKSDAMIIYKDAKSDAKRMNAFETIPAEPETDSWVLARY